MMRRRHRRLLVALLLFSAPALYPQSKQPLTVESIFGDDSSLPTAPTDFIWSPDSSTVAYIATGPDSYIHASAGDLIAVDTATSKERILARTTDLNLIYNANSHLTPIEFDRRNRYSEPSILFAPDSHTLLLDAAGTLYLFNPRTHHTRTIANAAVTADDPKFSPNGKFLSYIRDHGLFIHSLTGKEETLIATGSPTLLSGEVDWLYLEELNAKSNYFWSPDSTRIAYLQTDESHLPVYNIADADFAQRYPTPGGPNPAVRVAVANIASPSQPIFINLPISAGNDYIPRFGWINASTLWIEVLDRNQQTLRLYFADAATGRAAVVYTETDPLFLNDQYDFTFLHSGNQFLRIRWSDGHSHLYLYSFNAANPLASPAKLIRQLTTGDFDVESVAALSPDDSAVYFLSNEGSPTIRNLFAASLASANRVRITQSPSLADQLNGTHDISLSPDTGSFVDTYSTLTGTAFARKYIYAERNYTPSTHPPKSPGVTLDPSKRVFNALSSSSLAFVFWERPLPPLVPTLPLTLIAADNHTKLYAQLTLPATPHPANASIPLVLNPYGGPGEQHVRDQWQAEDSAFIQLLAQHGFAVLQVDNRGMAMRGRDFAQAAHLDFGQVQLADQLTALDQALALYPQLDANRIGIFGWSFGGSLSLYAMTHSTRFSTGIAVAPVTDWRLYDTAYTERYLGTPAVNPQAYAAGNLLTAAPSLHGHLLLAYGTGDDNVHAINSTEFIAALKRAHIHFDQISFPGQTHSLDSSDSRIQLYSRILSQLESDLHPARVSP